MNSESVSWKGQEKRKTVMKRGAWLAQSIEHMTLELQGHEFEPKVGHRVYLKQQQQSKQTLMKMRYGRGWLQNTDLSLHSMKLKKK